jgi:magnesium chelatase family protein
MVARIHTLAFEGIGARHVEVQVQLAPGIPAFILVGLPDKAVAESRERVRAALCAIGLALPPRRVVVNLSPADLPKEGSHFDLPIALGLMGALGVLPADMLERYVAFGELALDGALVPVSGALPAAMHAHAQNLGLICPQASGSEAAWAGEDLSILAAPSLLCLINHMQGRQMLSTPRPGDILPRAGAPDLADIKGQESAKRALEVAAAGGHNMLMCGPPGAGKSMLAQRLPGLLPPLSAPEMLEVSMIHSVAGLIEEGRLCSSRPFRAPHHSASMAAMIGGGVLARPGEVPLSHHGVLFLDELPEFARAVLDSLRQPLESGETVIARARAHVTYPSRIQLIAAMNPCRCGYATERLGRACSSGAHCMESYKGRISGPLLDRIDLHIDMPAVKAADLARSATGEGSAAMRVRVVKARESQKIRFAKLNVPLRSNAQAEGKILEEIATPEPAGAALLNEAAERMVLSARGYHRVLKVARTLADLDGAETIARLHIAEALSYRAAQQSRAAA